MLTTDNSQLTTKRVSALRKQAHLLNPVVLIGEKGLTDAVRKEITQALYDHELIKVKVAGMEKPEFLELADEIAEESAAELIQTIGRTIVLYRVSSKAKDEKLAKTPLKSKPKTKVKAQKSERIDRARPLVRRESKKSI